MFRFVAFTITAVVALTTSAADAGGAPAGKSAVV